MKEKRTFTFILVIALLSLVIPSIVSSYNFMGTGRDAFFNDTAEQGTSPTNYNWTLVSNTEPTYSTDQHANGTKSIKFTALGTISVEPLSPKQRNITWYQMTDTSLNNAESALLLFGDAAGLSSQWGMRVYGGQCATSHFCYFPGGGSWTDTGIAYQINTWYENNLQIYDNDTFVWTVRANDSANITQLATGQLYSLSKYQLGLSASVIGGGLGAAFFDTIYEWNGTVSSPPAPSNFTLTIRMNDTNTSTLLNDFEADINGTQMQSTTNGNITYDLASLQDYAVRGFRAFYTVTPQNITLDGNKTIILQATQTSTSSSTGTPESAFAFLIVVFSCVAILSAFIAISDAEMRKTVALISAALLMLIVLGVFLLMM